MRDLILNEFRKQLVYLGSQLIESTVNCVISWEWIARDCIVSIASWERYNLFNDVLKCIRYFGVDRKNNDSWDDDRIDLQLTRLVCHRKL